MVWVDKLKTALSKSSSKIGDGITAIFTKRKIDAETLAELEDLLIAADIGPKVAAEIIESFGKSKFGKEIGVEEIKLELAARIEEILKPAAKELIVNDSKKPHIILLCGVNGSGKTTTIGKLAAKFQKSGKKVMIAACDTFRAAAISQLKTWAERTQSLMISGQEGADPASVAFQALEQAIKEKYDVLLIDTAGRLQNKSALMDELKKIIKVLKKIDETAPQQTILVLDATTGQNAISQASIFKEAAAINGLIVNKLDGTARGGIVVALAKSYRIPIFAVGVGENVDDLQNFDTENFARNLVGL